MKHMSEARRSASQITDCCLHCTVHQNGHAVSQYSKHSLTVVPDTKVPNVSYPPGLYGEFDKMLKQALPNASASVRKMRWNDNYSRLSIVLWYLAFSPHGFLNKKAALVLSKTKEYHTATHIHLSITEEQKHITKCLTF